MTVAFTGNCRWAWAGRGRQGLIGMLNKIGVIEMQQTNSCEPRLDEDGSPDVNYYLAEARRLRSEAVSEMLRGAIVWLRGRFNSERGTHLRAAFIK